MQGSGERSAISQAKAVKSATAKIVNQWEKAAEAPREDLPATARAGAQGQ